MIFRKKSFKVTKSTLNIIFFFRLQMLPSSIIFNFNDITTVGLPRFTTVKFTKTT